MELDGLGVSSIVLHRGCWREGRRFVGGRLREGLLWSRSSKPWGCGVVRASDPGADHGSCRPSGASGRGADPGTVLFFVVVVDVLVIMLRQVLGCR